MQEAQNTQVVKAAYASFQRGDIQGVLNALDEEISWKPVIGASVHVAFGGTRHGKAAVADFFRLISETEVFEQFEPREFIAAGDKVVAIGHYRAKATATGRSFESDWAMVFTLRDGKVIEFREFTDSAALNAAFTPVGAAV